MRRLTVILSDLYLPEESVAESTRVRAIDLPAFEWLLRFAGPPSHVGDWRRWLLQQVGGGQFVNLPLATLCACEKVADPDRLNSAWIATPVALEARLDHVRLVDRGLLSLDAAERAACCAEFDEVFGPRFRLHDCGERALVLTGLPRGGAAMSDPARWLGSEIGPALPGHEAPELRRTWVEIEMWLHGSRFNVARVDAGRRPVSALWLWGSDGDRREPRTLARDLEILGRDALVAGLDPAAKAPPASLMQVEGRSDHVFAEFAALTGHAAESLPELETHWFGAARSMLASGALDELTLVANDRAFRVTPRSHWRFWQPRRGWLANLARDAKGPKA